MRPARLSLLLLSALAAGCSSVSVTPEHDVRAPPATGTQPALRGDRARTDAFPPGDSDGYRPPARLAVLLPMTGALSPAGASVRDGLLTAYYAETRARPVIHFYDTQGSASGAQAAVGKAIADGVQMIVGPLTRDEVNAVLAGGNLPVPLLTLNHGVHPPPGTAGFALLPDDEGAAAAQRLLDRGITSALVISNRTDSAQRTVAAFRAVLRSHGGDVVAELNAGEPDQAARLAVLPALPHPPGAVFLATDAAQARAAVGLLKVSPVGALPRIASSQILSGASARADNELDGVEYPELPWLLGQHAGLPDFASVTKSISSARGPAQRLFAFGADAWSLVAYFERLYNDPSFALPGATGRLHIDVDGSVAREMSWAVFSGGRGRPDTSPHRQVEAPAH